MIAKLSTKGPAMKKPLFVILILMVVGTGLLALSALAVPELAWRYKVVGHKALGHIDDVSWSQLLTMLKPGSGFYLRELTETQNIYSAARNPLNSAKDIDSGAKVFASNCVTCHGADASGGSAPALADGLFKHGASDWALYRNITLGIDGTTMVAAGLDDTQTWQVIAWLRSLAEPETSDAGNSNAVTAYRSVSPQRLLNSRSEPENWLTYSGHYDGTRYSDLDQVTRDNAGSLQVRWLRQLVTDELMVEATPIVNDGIMLVTEPPNIVHALDARTGKSLWTHQRPIPKDVVICCGMVNRGVAVHGDRVYLGTLDAHIVALDAKTGAVVWDTQVDDYESGISITAAPLVVKDLVIVGVSGGEFGIRGYLDAYDAKTGERVWRFHTIPGPGEPGHDSWAGESWKTGGAPTWLTGAYDPQLNLIYWGVGNPGPLFQAQAREGDNLYSCSVVALDADTGELAWHFQFTPNDEHDWDSNQIPLLVDRPWNGVERKLMLWANRNAFFYVLDRETGEFLLGKPFAKQNWAYGLDAAGRPQLRPETRVSAAGAVTWPSPNGAMNWQSPTYSKATGYMYIPAMEYGQIVFKQEDPVEFEEGKHYMGSGHQNIHTDSMLYTAVRAINPDNGELIWEHRNPDRPSWWKTGGLVSTAGGIVFGGDNTRFYVLDDTSGEQLWELEVGGRINASPMTHMLDDEQRFVFAAGRAFLSIGLPPGHSRDDGQDVPDVQ